MVKKKGNSVDEPLVKKRIRLVIGRKQKMLSKVSEDEKLLRNELMRIKMLHDSTIGVLYTRIDALDEEIFGMRRLQDLLDKDMDMKDALQLLEKRAKAEAEKKEQEAERQKEEMARFMKPRQTPEIGLELKKLWRKLAFKFHPDLVQDEEEKKEREAMMQKVNDAYARGDLGGLRLLEESASSDLLDVDTSMESLEQTLVDIESCIKRTNQKIMALMRSEWHTMKLQIEEAKQGGFDMLGDLEKKLKNQINLREKNIKDLKKKLGIS